MQTNSDSGSDSWEARDLQSMLHGFTHLGSLNDDGPVVVPRGEGIYVEDIHGNRYLEGNSGLWNAVAGFNHAGLIEAACEQIRRFPRLSRLLRSRQRILSGTGRAAPGNLAGSDEQGLLYQLRL